MMDNLGATTSFPNYTVVLRFYLGDRGSDNPVISKTLGRVAVIAHTYEGPMPQPESFWVCRIDQHRNTSFNKGCFVVTPLYQVPYAKIVKLIPSTYDIEEHGDVIVCKPKIAGHYWIVPFNIKKYYIKEKRAKVMYVAVIAPLDVDESTRQT